MPIFEGQPQSVIYDPTIGYLTDANGTPLTHEAYDYADFATIDTSYKRYILINDLHSANSASGASGGSRWLVNPLASTPEEKIVLDSGSLWFDTYAAYTSAITASDHPGLRVHIGNVGSGIPVLVNKYSTTLSAYRLVPENKSCNLFDLSFGTLASPTLSILAAAAVTSGEFGFGDRLLPGGLVKSGDTFQIRGGFARRASGATTNTSFLVALNTTNNDVGAAYVFTHTAVSGSLNSYHVNFDFEFRASGTTTFTTHNGFTGEHVVPSLFVDRTTNVNFNADMYLNAFCGSKDATHTVDLLYLSLDWRASL